MVLIIVGDERACTSKWIIEKKTRHVLHAHITSQKVATIDDVYCYSLLLLLRDGS
jgi:hypothetical protein